MMGHLKAVEFSNQGESSHALVSFIQCLPEVPSIITDPFLIWRVSSISPSYVSCVHIGVTISISLSSNTISSMPPLPAGEQPA